MTSAEVDERLQAGLERVARFDGRAIDEVRQEAIRRYLATRGLSLLDDLAGSSAGVSLSDEEAQAIASEELDRMREERWQSR
ncbi:MAG: hypothetical protein WD080_13220 [Egibacteraceae bacterium]